MKDETGDIVIKTFVGLKPKVYSYLVDNNEHKKANDNKNVAAIGDNEYKDVLSKNKCFRHSVNRI